MIPPHEQLNCLGYFGFGGGYLLGRMRTGINHRGELYCNTCPASHECWQKHRERIQSLLPELTKAVDEALNGRQGKEYFDAMKDAGLDPAANPYICANLGNIEDGLAVALTGAPKDRAEFTIPWPFKGQ